MQGMPVIIQTRDDLNNLFILVKSGKISGRKLAEKIRGMQAAQYHHIPILSQSGNTVTTHYFYEAKIGQTTMEGLTITNVEHILASYIDENEAAPNQGIAYEKTITTLSEALPPNSKTLSVYREKKHIIENDFEKDFTIKELAVILRELEQWTNTLVKADYPAYPDATVSADMTVSVNQYLTAAGSHTLTLASGCMFTVSGTSLRTAAANISAGHLDTGSGFTAGHDYYVYICDDGTGCPNYKVSLNSTFPKGYDDLNSRKIGGFHFGRCRHTVSTLRPINESGEVYGDGWETNTYDGIVPQSVWTLKHRPCCTPEGMVYLGHGVWVDIYLSSDDGMGGLQSVYGGTPLTGTEGHNWYSFNDRALLSGKRLLSYAEFCQMAYGSPQGNDEDNNNAWTMVSNIGRNPSGYVADAVSSIGCRDAVGNVWEWLRDVVLNANGGTVLMGQTGATDYTYLSYDGSRAGQVDSGGTNHGATTRTYASMDDPVGGAWMYDKTSPLGDTAGGNPKNGNVYQYYDWQTAAFIGGATWYHGTQAGCRSINTTPNGLWHVCTTIGVRCACESL